MKIESTAFEHKQSIPSKYTCDGDNVSPELVFSEIPEGVKSFTLIVDDPDASTGMWVHWTIWNIAPETTKLTENTVPQGTTEGITDFGKPGYGGPCPHAGEHRYFFKLYALDTVLDLDESTDKLELESAMSSHILASAELIGFYARARK